MPLKDDLRRVEHMLTVAEEILEFTEGKTYQDLLADRGLQYICIHCIELLGEAANIISQELRSKYTDIPWRPITAMRNRLIHGYLDIELSFIWSTVADDVPALIPKLRYLLTNEQGDISGTDY